MPVRLYHRMRPFQPLAEPSRAPASSRNLLLGQQASDDAGAVDDDSV